MSISKIRENAREALRGKWGKAACIMLAYLAFFIAVEFATGIFGENSPLGVLLSIAAFIVQVPITFGLAFAFIRLKRNEDIKAFDYLNMAMSNFARSWKITLRVFLKMLLPFLGILLGMLIFVGISVYITAASIMSGTSSSIVLPVILGIIVYIVAIIWLVAVSLRYALTTCIAYDNPNMSSLEVVNESAKMMKGNRGKYFLLELSFIGWAILTIFTLGIGYLWLLPYMQVAVVCFYEHLLGKKENNISEENVEAITEM